MNKKRRLMSLTWLLGMVIMLGSGCGDTAGDERGGNRGDLAENGFIKAGSGRFIEEEISLPKEIRKIQAMRKLSDGSLELIGNSGQTDSCLVLRSSDGGKKWSQQKIDGLGRDYYPQTAIAADGRAVLLNYMEEKTVKATIAEADGSTKNFSFSLPEDAAKDTDNRIVQASYDTDGNLVVLDMYGALYVVTAAGKCEKAYDTRGGGHPPFQYCRNDTVCGA